jgi:hypothetical protein
VTYTRRVCEGVVLGSILTLCVSMTAQAQEQQDTSSAHAETASTDAAVPSSSSAAAPSATADGQWHFQSWGYLWFPGMHGTVGARGYDSSVSVSAVDILSHFNIGLMGAFEAQHNRWGFPFEYVWVKLSDENALINFPDYSVKTTVKEGFFTPKATYLVVDSEKVRIRATAGVRVWHLGENLKLSPPNTSSVNVGTSQNWADVVGGANFVVPLSPKILVMVGGDAGGGGANVDYQVSGLVNYQIKPKWGIGVGYRYLDVNYRNSNKVIFDTASSGIALTLLYKFGKQPGQ